MSPFPAQNKDYDLPDNFLRLQADIMPLKPIHSKKDYNKALQVLEALISRDKLTKAQSQYLEVLSSNVNIYESQQIETVKDDPVSVLKFLLAQNELNASDLGRILGSRTLGPAILNGSRALSKANIKKLADHFSVNPALFL